MAAQMSKAELFHLLESDLYRSGQKRMTLIRLAFIYFFRHGIFKAYIFIRLNRYFHLRGWATLSRTMARKLRHEFGSYVSAEAQIGAGLRLPHPLGIVIGDGVRIGDHCTLYQQVTIGGARSGDAQAGHYPSIHDNVTLFAGSKVVGNVALGSGVTVGANAVVTKDVPAHHVAVEVPAKIRPKSVPDEAVQEKDALSPDHVSQEAALLR